MRRHLAWILILGISGCQSWKTFWLAGLNVTAITPASGATGVAVFATVTVTFDKTLDASTVSTATISLASTAGTVDATLTLSGSTVTLKPKKYLSVGTEYTVRISTDLKGAGNTSLSETSAYLFSTMTANSFVSHVGAMGGAEQISSVARFSDGSYAMTGYMQAHTNNMQATSGVVPLSGYSHSTGAANDCFVGRFRADGTVVWYLFVGVTAQSDTCIKVVVTRDDGVAIIGKSANGTLNLAASLRVNNYVSGSDAFVAKFTGAGQLTWWGFFGGTGTDDAISLAEDSQGNLIAAISLPLVSGISADISKRILPIQGTGANTGLIKLSSTGVLQWYTHFGDPDSSTNFILSGLVVGSDDSLYTVGAATLGITNYSAMPPLVAFSGSQDGIIVKHNSAGQAQWYTFVGAGGSQQFKAGAVTSDGTLIFGGDTTATFSYQGLNAEIGYSGQTDALVYSCSPTGTPLWMHFFGGSGIDQFMNFQLAADGGYALLMFTDTLFSFQGKSLVYGGGGGGQDPLIVRFNSSRQLQWHTSLGGGGAEQANSLIEAHDGGWLTGGFASSNQSGVGGKTAIYGFDTSNDAVYTKVKPDGSF